MRKSPHSVEAKFKKKFNGVIWRSVYNAGNLSYLLNGKEYDLSFLTKKRINQLMIESLEKDINLIFDICKNHEIIRTKTNDDTKHWRIYY